MSAGSLNIVADGLELQIDASNKLGDNVSSVKNIVTPTEISQNYEATKHRFE